ncbi:efflux RND transporter permease subunit [Salinispirillum marinum]|uniref:Efflux RND transporter permease subunit n=2 Tax=Saccharospirillaceae TaxID=255527 RepID=A0ABV8BII9_9GAMM
MSTPKMETNTPQYRQPAAANALLSYFARHRVAANLMMLFVILLGFLGMSRLNTQIFPDVTPGAAAVVVEWSSAGAEAILDQVTRPLEKAILDLPDVDRLTSNSRDGASALSVYFNAGADFERAMNELRKTVDGVALPAAAEEPNVREYSFSEPVILLILTYDGVLEELRPLVNRLTQEFKQRGIPDVTVYGFDDPELVVEVTAETLKHNGWTLDELAQRIRSINNQYAAGSAGDQAARRNLVSGERVLTAVEMAQLPLGSNRTLGDVATLKDASGDPALRMFFEGQPVVMLQLNRSAAMDTLGTAEIYQQWFDEAADDLPGSVGVHLFYDTSEFVLDNINLLLTNGLFGLVFVLITLFVFLNLRVAFWTAMGIPVAIFGTMALMYFTGNSLNFFSIFAMLMALGIIVDDAIVVGEETQSLIEQGVDHDKAAGIAATHMFSPVLASLLTTVAAFSPLLFVPGIFGELLRPIPMVIIAVIIASMVECFLILPGHLHHSFAKRSGRAPSQLRQTVDRWMRVLRDDFYRPLVTRALQYRMFTVSLAISLLVLANGLIGSGQVQFSQDLEIEDDRVMAEVDFMDDTPRQDIEQFVATMNAALQQTDEHFSARHGAPVVQDKYYEFDIDNAYAFFMVRLPVRDDRQFSNHDFLGYWESVVERTPVVERLRIQSESGGGASSREISLRLVGDDTERLAAGSRMLKAQLEQRGDLRNIEDTLPTTHRQMDIQLTSRARALGVSEQALAAQIAVAVDGVTIQRHAYHGTDLNVVLRMDEQARGKLELVNWLMIQLPNGQQLPLSELARFSVREELSAIFQYNGQQSVTVTAEPLSEEIRSQDLQAELQRDVLPEILRQYDLSVEYQTGQDAAELLDNLILAGYIAAALIYLILAWMFQSYSWPIAVMLVIPFAMTGAVAGHWIMGFDLTFLSIFGLFGLAGIVINGAIVLIVRYREMLEEGFAPDVAIVEACCQRFRPVVLTTLTTVSGLVPILFESSVQAQLVRSMATSMAFGLGFGAVLVLLVVPSLLSYVQSATAQVLRLSSWFMRPVRSNHGRD